MSVKTRTIDLYQFSLPYKKYGKNKLLIDKVLEEDKASSQPPTEYKNLLCSNKCHKLHIKKKNGKYNFVQVFWIKSL